MPAQYRAVMNDPELIPAWFQSDVHTDAQHVIDLNDELRTTGFSGDPWPDEYVALGTDPGGNVYFMDTREPDLPIFLANHELIGSGSVSDSAAPCAGSFDEWLVRLRELNAQIEAETPYAVFSAGMRESEELRANPGAESLEALFWSRARPFCALPPSHIDRITTSLFRPLFVNVPGHVSFALLEPAAQLALREHDPCVFRAAVGLLADIAQAAGTSEMPAAVERSWEELRMKVVRSNLETSTAWEALKRQFRR